MHGSSNTSRSAFGVTHRQLLAAKICCLLGHVLLSSTVTTTVSENSQGALVPYATQRICSVANRNLITHWLNVLIVTGVVKSIADTLKLLACFVCFIFQPGELIDKSGGPVPPKSFPAPPSQLPTWKLRHKISHLETSRSLSCRVETISIAESCNLLYLIPSGD